VAPEGLKNLGVYIEEKGGSSVIPKGNLAVLLCGYTTTQPIHEPLYLNTLVGL
jgi:hypothetical protein